MTPGVPGQVLDDRLTATSRKSGFDEHDKEGRSRKIERKFRRSFVNWALSNKAQVLLHHRALSIVPWSAVPSNASVSS